MMTTDEALACVKALVDVQKIENKGRTAQGRLSSDEWNAVVLAVWHLLSVEHRDYGDAGELPIVLLEDESLLDGDLAPGVYVVDGQTRKGASVTDYREVVEVWVNRKGGPRGVTQTVFERRVGTHEVRSRVGGGDWSAWSSELSATYATLEELSTYATLEELERQIHAVHAGGDCEDCEELTIEEINSLLNF